MNDWMCARSAAMRSAARTCCMRALGADADEFVEAAGRDGDAAAVEEGDRLHRAIQQAAVVRHQQHRAGEAGEPLSPATASLPGRGGWSARRAAAGRGRRTARWPAPRACASRRRIPRTGRGWAASSKPRPARMAAARAGAASAPMARRRSWISARRCGFGGVGLREQGEAFGVALQHGVQQGGVAGRAPPARRWRCGRGRRGGCRRRPAASRRRWRAAAWTCRRRCGRPGRCGGPGPR